jgi:hypothetical protein
VPVGKLGSLSGNHGFSVVECGYAALILAAIIVADSGEENITEAVVPKL